jgi:glycosyltransferase involved in cell wall biosynthesis
MKFTIGLPITKTKHLKAALESLINQSFNDYEIIIKNNGANSEKKKEIKEICEEWMNNGNVSYFESEGQLTMGPNFNTILERAKGDYFVIMSDDDILELNYLEEFNILINKYPNIDVFHCRTKFIDENDKFIRFSENSPEFESRIDLIYNKLAYGRTIILSDFLVATKTLKKYGGFPSETTAYGLDEITWLKCSSNGIASTPKVLLNYRIFLGNISFDPKNMMNRYKELDFLKNQIETIIIEEVERNNGIYPLDFLLEQNQKRNLKEKEFLFIDFASSNNLKNTIVFYLKNKNNIPLKALLKGLSTTKVF